MELQYSSKPGLKHVTGLGGGMSSDVAPLLQAGQVTVSRESENVSVVAPSHKLTEAVPKSNLLQITRRGLASTSLTISHPELPSGSCGDVFYNA